jgi:hypothetical protein
LHPDTWDLPSLLHVIHKLSYLEVENPLASQ